jgi:hypothetical protein
MPRDEHAQVKEKAMERLVMFLDCPAYLDNRGAARCGLPAEVQALYTMNSTDGPLDSAKISCPRGHWFNGPVESLIMPGQPAAVSGIGQPAAVSEGSTGRPAL